MSEFVKNVSRKILLLFVATCIVPCAVVAQESRQETDALEKAFAEAYGTEAPVAPSLLGEPDYRPGSIGQRNAIESSAQMAELPPKARQLDRSGDFVIPQTASQDPESFQQTPGTAAEYKNTSGPVIYQLKPVQEADPSHAYREERDPNSMWWHSLVIDPLDQRNTEMINPQILLHMALQNSPRILAISKRPLIRETEVGEARADFDPELFVKSQFDDRVDPVGNQLTTGTGDPFLKEHIWYSDMGLRRKLWAGGEIEAKQRFGFQNSNSRFFEPQDQGTTTLSLNFSQPLLKGRGVAYNRSQIMIAQLGGTASWDQFAAELQDELTEVVESYWALYYHRAVLLQKQYNVERGETVLQKLEGRSKLDSLPSQIARARSAVQSRRTELANARRDVRNAETDIRRLTGSSEIFKAVAAELLPEEAPTLIRMEQDLAGMIEMAIQLRPEVKQAMQRARIAAVQKNVSEHELLPELNLIFNTYVSALRGTSDVFGAWSDQFTASTPGYAVGFEFNLPYHRRAARSRNKRQQLVLEQVRHEIDQTVNDVVAEAQVAWRQVDSAYQTAMAAAEAIKAARTDLLQNEARWESFALVEGDFAEGQTPTTLLDQLLDAQQRLANAELTYSQALLEFKGAEVGLKRATGELLSHHEVAAYSGYSTQAGPVYGQDQEIMSYEKPVVEPSWNQPTESAPTPAPTAERK